MATVIITYWYVCQTKYRTTRKNRAEIESVKMKEIRLHALYHLKYIIRNF